MHTNPADHNPQTRGQASRAGEGATSSRQPHPSSDAGALRPLPPTVPVDRMLVPLDGTFYAERALPYAAALARLTGASMALGHVHAPPVPAPAQTAKRVVEEMIGAEQDARVADLAGYLEAQRVLQSFRAPAVSVETIEDRDTVFGVRQLAQRGQCDLIVLATHARQGIERRVLGSLADGLVEQSEIPLLIIPPNVAVPAEMPTFVRFLIPLDGSDIAERALGLLVTLLPPMASDVQRQVTLFTVAESHATMADGGAYLDEVEARLRASALPAEVGIEKRVVLGSAPGAIVAMADHSDPTDETVSRPFDLVVMATHGRGGLGRLLYGSIGSYVLPRVAAPVLLVHPAEGSM